jgi:hypothetical protein
MLHLIKVLTDQFFEFLKDDPVRPHIPHVNRVGNNKDIFVLKDTDDTAKAITCVSYQNFVPATECELFNDVEHPTVAVFYTIWSYKPGSGRELIHDAVSYIKNNQPEIERFVTLSPPTDMARKFHHKNGAITLRINEDAQTVNYEYVQKKELKLPEETNCPMVKVDSY